MFCSCARIIYGLHLIHKFSNYIHFAWKAPNLLRNHSHSIVPGGLLVMS